MTEGKKRETAHSLEEAANSGNSLEGYEAINDVVIEEPASGRAEAGAEDEEAEICRLAYQYYEERGREDGYAEQDWLRAEREVRGRQSASHTAS